MLPPQMQTLTPTTLLAWLERAAFLFSENQEHLTALDSAIGDADHGVNMQRGFQAVAAKLPGLKEKTINEIFKTTAMTLISTVGGASGPLFGSFFLQAAAAASGKSELTLQDLHDCFAAGTQSVAARGKAAAGDKTMLDALLPATAAFAGETLHTALLNAGQAARIGADATIPWVAKKGRASYLGERSAGHLDPGAESVTILLRALAEVTTSD